MMVAAGVDDAISASVVIVIIGFSQMRWRMTGASSWRGVGDLRPDLLVMSASFSLTIFPLSYSILADVPRLNGPYVVVAVLAAIWLIAQPGRPSRAGRSTSA